MTRPNLKPDGLHFDCRRLALALNHYQPELTSSSTSSLNLDHHTQVA
jgi:hypothetical protein